MLLRNIAAGALLVAGSACYLLGIFAYVSELLRLVATFIPASTPLWATALAWLLVVPAAAPLGWAPMLLLGWWAEVALPAGLGLLGWGLTRAAAAAAGPGADEAEAVRARGIIGSGAPASSSPPRRAIELPPATQSMRPRRGPLGLSPRRRAYKAYRRALTR